MTAVAVVAAALAGWWMMPPSPRGLVVASQRRAGSGRAAKTVMVITAVLVATALVALGGGPGRSAVAAGLVVMTVMWLLLRRRRQRQTEKARQQVSEGCQTLSSQLLAGALPGRALAVAAEDCAVLQRAAASQRIGGDVVHALREAAGRPGCAGLEDLAAAWQLAERSGAPIADLVARVAEQRREEQRLLGLVGGELAAPRATGKLLAGLPLVGIMMAAAVGADPATFLLRTLPGQLCVVGAAMLTCAGLVWTEWLADRGLR